MAIAFASILIAALVVVCIALTARWIVGSAARQAGASFRAADIITNESRVPAFWTRPLWLSIDRLRQKGASDCQIEQDGRAAKARLLDRLEVLIRFMQRVQVFEDEETRTIVLDRLRQAHSRWSEQSWQELLRRDDAAIAGGLLPPDTEE